MRRFLSALFTLALAACTSATAQPREGSQGIAIVGADVLPMTRTERLRDQTVLVSGDRITRVGPRARVAVPAGYRVIQARGKTLMPGLVDMHVHLSPEPGKPGDATQRALAVMLAHGVTTTRTMAGGPSHPQVREAIERGEIVGPRLYAAAPFIHQGNTKTAEAARAAVASAKTAGYDLIKSHALDDVAVWQAVQDEARRQGLPTAGHVTNPVGLDRAMAAGQQVEHLDGVIAELLPKAPAPDLAFGQLPPPPVLEAAGRASDAQLAALARRIAAARSYHVPTLSLFESIADVRTASAALRARPEMRFVPAAALEQWARQREPLVANFPAEAGDRLTALRRRIVGALHKAGVPLMAGSDTAQAFHVWGPALHREIEALAAAGMTPMEALRSATVVPRDYFRSLPNGGSALGWKADFGTVEEGARADLILLGADPSRDLAALASLDMVIAAGKVHERAALDGMLERAAADAKAAVPPPAPVAAAGGGAGAAAASGSGPANIYVMRHLDKGEGQDPPLSEAGTRNAQRLAAWFTADPPAAIYVSATRRAQETAAPLAARVRVTAKTYNPSDTPALIERVRAERGNVLIVGHSNTVPDIIERLGGARPEPIGEERYGDIWHMGPDRRAQRKSLGGGMNSAEARSASR
jgi:imidazolonepropionase-like amidohydrolase/phosphohistidine phosphatase SixA